MATQPNPNCFINAIFEIPLINAHNTNYDDVIGLCESALNGLSAFAEGLPDISKQYDVPIYIEVAQAMKKALKIAKKEKIHLELTLKLMKEEQEKIFPPPTTQH